MNRQNESLISGRMKLYKAVAKWTAQQLLALFDGALGECARTWDLRINKSVESDVEKTNSNQLLRCLSVGSVFLPNARARRRGYSGDPMIASRRTRQRASCTSTSAPEFRASACSA